MRQKQSNHTRSVSTQQAKFVCLLLALGVLLLVACTPATEPPPDAITPTPQSTVTGQEAPALPVMVAQMLPTYTPEPIQQPTLLPTRTPLPTPQAVADASRQSGLRPKQAIEGAAVATWTPTPLPTATPLPPTPLPTSTPWVDLSTGNSMFNEERWIDVNLSTQYLTAYENGQSVYEVYVSTGAEQWPTVTGQFRIWLRYDMQTMDGTHLGFDYNVTNVPHVQYFYKDYALHGAYWHNNFGTPVSHGCVNLTTYDAEWLYNFAGIGTLVNVHY